MPENTTPNDGYFWQSWPKIWVFYFASTPNHFFPGLSGFKLVNQ